MAADEVPSFDDIPSFDDMPENAPTQASAGASAGPPRFDDIPSFDDMPGGQPQAEGQLKTFGREAASAVLPGIAAAAGAIAAPAIAGSVVGPVGTLAGFGLGIAGALAGGYAGSKVQDVGKEALGLDDSTQLAINREANPKSAMAGQVAGSMATMSPSMGAGAVERLLAGGVMGGVTAGQELATTGKVDPTELAMSAAAGAIAPRFNRFGQKIESAVNSSVARVAGRPNKTPNPEAAPVQDEAAASQQATVAGENALQQPAPSATGDTTGNPQSAPERSERVYGKGQRPEDYQNDMLTQGEFSPDVAAALRKSTQDTAVGDYSNQPQPEIPQPEPKAPDIDKSLQEAPVPTGLAEAAAPVPKPEVATQAPKAPPEVIGKPNRAERQAQLDSITEKPEAPKATAPASEPVPKFDEMPHPEATAASAAAAADAKGHVATPGQKEAENYGMGHSRMFGRAVSWENAKGSTRTAKDGSWKTENLPYDIGKFLGTKGADNDHVDLLNVGTGDKHFIVDQRNADTGAFDEHKVMAYAKDINDAVDHYNRGFSDDRGPDRLGSIKEVSADDLKAWLAKPGKKKTPYDPNFKTGEAVGPAEGTKPLPKVVTAAVKKINDTVSDPALRKKMVDELMGMEPSKQIGAASKAVNETKNVLVRPDRIRGAVPTVEGLTVTAKDKASAEGKTRNVKALNDAFEATKPPPEPAKGNNGGPALERESKAETVARARKFVELAKAADFKMKGTNKAYRPATDNHAPTAYERAAKKLTIAKNPTDKSVEAFRAQEALLRSGKEENVAEARATSRINADIEKSKRAGEDAITNADIARTAPGRNDVEDAMIEHLDRKFETPHEEAEAMVEPEPAATKADVERLSPKNDELDISKPDDRAKLHNDTQKFAENLQKTLARKAPEKPSEEKKVDTHRVIPIDSIDTKKIMAALERAQNKNVLDKAENTARKQAAKTPQSEAARMQAEWDKKLADLDQPTKNVFEDFINDDNGSLNYKKITDDFKNHVLPKVTGTKNYWHHIFGTPVTEGQHAYDATYAQSNSTADARMAEKAKMLFEDRIDPKTGAVLEGRFYQWLKDATPEEMVTFQKTIENPDFDNSQPAQELIKAGLPAEKVNAWMKDEVPFWRGVMDHTWKQDKLRGSDQEYVQNYVTHIFKDNNKVDGMTADQWIERRIQNLGPTWYQKERVFDLIDAAMKAGFKPKFENPIELLNARLDASIRSNTLVDAARALNKDGAAFNAADHPQSYEHFAKLWPFKVRLPDGNTWAIAPDAAEMWTNAMDPKGLNENKGTPGSIYRTWMGWKKFSVPIQLMISAFHGLHEVANIAVVQNLQTMFREGRATGEWTKAVTKAAKNVGTDTIFSLPMMVPGINRMVRDKDFWKNYGGMRMQDVWRTPDAELHPDDLMWKRLFQEGGMSPYQSREDVIGAKRSLAQAVHDFGEAANKVGPGMKVALRGIQRGMELMQEPLFKDTIPAMKNMAYKRAIAAAHAEMPEIAVNGPMRKQVLRQIGKDVDDRFGEMFYKNLFWNKTTKDIGIGAMLSLSWNLGQFRQLAGAGREATSKLLDVIDPSRATGRSKIESARRAASNKLGFVTTYTGVSMATAGMISYMLSGEAPSGMDYIYPRNGLKNPEDGSPQRLTTMFNTREPVMAKAHMDERNSVIGGLGQLVWNKTVLQPVAELAMNKDFFGNKLYDTNAPWWKAALQSVDSTLGRTFNPISISGATRAKELGAGKTGEALSFLGFGPAPKYVNEDPDQRRMGHLYKEEGTAAYRPYQYGAKTGLGRGLVQDTIRGIAGDKLQAEEISDARRRLALGDPDARKDLIEKGKLNKNTVRHMMPGTEFEYKFSKLPPDDQIALVKTMTAANFDRYVMRNKSVAKSSHFPDLLKARAETHP